MPTFEDITSLERKHAQLRKVLIRLRKSRKVVRRQNHELKALATRDPLTGCFNRRTLFAEFEKHWETSERSKRPLACMMVDIDHFKDINDEYGHSAGDQVLKGIAETLRQTARRSDFVCRYGGEEFCILLPQVDLDEALQAAERFREALTAEPFGGIKVTASFGVSARCLGAKHPQELLDEADKALLAAKRSGRNRSIRFDKAPPELLQGGPDTSRRKPDSEPVVQFDDGSTSIPYQAVSGLLAALAYRHPETAEHSKRVADLCVTVGCGLLSQKELYVVEMGALLHDLGKLGVPDNVLLKNEALTPEDWNTLRAHETMGVEIIRTAFTSEALEAIVQMQNAWFGGTPTDSSLPKGTKIPIGARLLAIVNAYDSMTNDQVYRKARPQTEAFAELRRCAGTQFDPALVDHFILAMANPSVTPPRKLALTVNKRAALRIGVQIEKLANAADVQDVAGLKAMAGQLKAMAEESGIATIAEVAGRLERTAASNANHVELMELTIELLEHCRQTQRTLLPQVRSRISRAERKRTASGEWRLPSKMELRLPNIEPRPKPPSI
jgi:diguanylate cyclase (GGDEF)-like protein